MKFLKYSSLILGLPKSIYLNMKMLPFRQAVKLPIILSKNTKIYSANGHIKLKSKAKFGSIKIGFGYVGTFDIRKRKSILELNGNLILGNNINLGHGTKLSVGDSGLLEIYDDVTITAETSIICFENISIGKGSMISWDNLFMDTDFHKIYDLESNILNKDKAIEIGENVWIGCRCTILKGANIKRNSVISSNSKISQNIQKESCIIGNNGVVLKENIRWEK
ncbi:acyltransferase [Clostridium perfringens]|uniref:acyltransferase n=1 Tax=Clostridium perfringens TaxID=1502 RepID=UPI001A34C505|nr:hypothetical protein [Clostridium perfringens]MDK0893276.1 hypothetical protein [Clostridium perfringens]MDT7984939.1 hypothetical protein [Clostridium perfringens]MDT8040348.1 hypothetical protein [Clostridium perfringens]MDZ5037225.1 acyltransferase [Clostridium perfringens]HAT4169018.1 acyltransferase [Clostridium perfringens]